jgi:hypothetical protein
MNIETLDIEFLAIVAMAFTLVLVPILGFTIRFALTPTDETVQFDRRLTASTR